MDDLFIEVYNEIWNALAEIEIDDVYDYSSNSLYYLLKDEVCEGNDYFPIYDEIFDVVLKDFKDTI